MKKCRSCGSNAVSKSESGKRICKVCLVVAEDGALYKEEYTSINFKNQRKIDTGKVEGQTPAGGGSLSLQEYLERKLYPI